MSEEKFFDCIFNKFPNKEVSYQDCIDIKNQFVPEKLYKYTRAKYAEELLIENLIYLPTIKELNDPYEARLFLNNERLKKEIYKNIDLNNFPKEMADEVIQDSSNKLSDEINTEISQDYSVICLSKDNCINPLWGNYADKYQGICLEYNLKDTEKTYLKDFCFPIKYVEREEDFEQIKSNESFAYNNIPFEPLLKKSFDWNYEKEWRVIIYKPDFQNMIEKKRKNCKIKEYLKFIEPTRVYLGLNIEKDYENRILRICKDKGIEVCKMEIDNTNYNFKFKYLYKK